MCVCLLVMFVNSAKMAEPIEKRFGGVDSRGPMKPLLTEVEIHTGMGNFRGCPAILGVVRPT